MTHEEALTRIKTWHLDVDTMEVLSALIPELRESEDEKIRNSIIRLLQRGGYLNSSTPLK